MSPLAKQNQTGLVATYLASFEMSRHFVAPVGALQLSPNDAEAQNNLATALANLGRMSEAAEHFQKAVQLKPTYLEAWKNLLLAYDQLHRTDDAIATARKLLDLAKSQNQTALAKRIEQWLSAHQSATPSKK